MITSTSGTALTATLLVETLRVVSAERLSSSFVRVVLAGEGLQHFGAEGPTYDQRVKLVFPGASGTLPSFEGADDSWFDTWLDLPAEERGHMRTYTVREVRGEGVDTRLVVDFVVHGDPPEGPGAAWGLAAVPGDRVVVVGPRRGVPYGGIEFDPGEAKELLLVGDETAVPAVASTLAQLPTGARGVVFLEVPWADDLQLLPAPEGMDVRWLPRSGEEPGSRLVPAVRRHLGLGETAGSGPDRPVDESDEDVWETPMFSSAGDPIAPAPPLGDHYAWIAGESGVVRTLRRTLVSELGWGRHQVAFMGYWRQGVAMRS